jgi:hypothetical protein
MKILSSYTAFSNTAESDKEETVPIYVLIEDNGVEGVVIINSTDPISAIELINGNVTLTPTQETIPSPNGDKNYVVYTMS